MKHLLIREKRRGNDNKEFVEMLTVKSKQENCEDMNEGVGKDIIGKEPLDETKQVEISFFIYFIMDSYWVTKYRQKLSLPHFESLFD